LLVDHRIQILYHIINVHTSAYVGLHPGPWWFFSCGANGNIKNNFSFGISTNDGTRSV